MDPRAEWQESWAVLPDMSPIRETDKAIYFCQVSMENEQEDIFEWIPKSHIHSACVIPFGQIAPLLVTQWMAGKKSFVSVGKISGREQDKIQALLFPQAIRFEEQERAAWLSDMQAFAPRVAPDIPALRETRQASTPSAQALERDGVYRTLSAEYVRLRGILAVQRRRRNKVQELGALSPDTQEYIANVERRIEKQEREMRDTGLSPSLLKEYGDLVLFLIRATPPLWNGPPRSDTLPPQAPPPLPATTSPHHRQPTPIRIITLDTDDHE